MAALKFMNTLLKDPKTAPLFESGVLSAVRCVEIVRRFRQKYSAIPVLWNNLQVGFTGLVTHGGSTQVGPLLLMRVADRVDIRLPSGRVLRYPQVRLVERTSTIVYLDIAGEKQEFNPSGPSLVYGEGEGISLYGGKLTENVVQAIARDVMVEAMLRAEERGVFTLAHVHDEVIAMAPRDRAKEVQAILTEEFTRSVPWMPELPLGADTKILERYTK